MQGRRTQGGRGGSLFLEFVRMRMRARTHEKRTYTFFVA